MSRHSTHDNRMEMELEMYASLCSLVYQMDQGFTVDGETMDAARHAINGWDDYWNEPEQRNDFVSKEEGLANVRALREHLNRDHLNLLPPAPLKSVPSITDTPTSNTTPTTITQRHWDESSPTPT